MKDFVHLHNHSHYSLQDAAATVKDLVKTAVKYEMKAFALTDHGVMYGVQEFYKEAKKANLKPLIGMEGYIVLDGSRFDKKNSANGDEKRSKNYYHIVFIAKNKTGFKNLVKLTSIGFKEGFYYRPRIDLEVLKKYSDGIICCSACAGGIVAKDIVNDNLKKARETVRIFKEIFGDDFYLEIQNHFLEIEKPILEWMPKLAKEFNVKLVCSNDIHYIEKSHAIPHNILLLIGDKGDYDYKNLRYKTDQVYFKSKEEMIELFKDFPEAIESTIEIADKCDLSLETKEYLHPKFPIPPDSKAKTEEEYFKELAEKGLKERFENITKEIRERFDYEVETIIKMGFAGYFLIVQDFINYAKNNGIPVGPGRGSAAGSLVAYCLKITDVNPLDYGLLFERFLNPERKSMPDIDVDFADDKREKVIEFVKNRYGKDSVCQIITFNKLSSKAVLRDVGRVIGIPLNTVNQVTKYIPSIFGKVLSIDEALEQVKELEWIKESKDEKIREWIEYSKALEGIYRGAGKHAAGVVITPGPVDDNIPIALAVNAESPDDLVTQYSMKELEAVGALKMDFLGLRTLTIIRDAIELIEKNRKIKIDIQKIPLDDKKTYELFAKGQTTAIFQFESGPMREYLRRLKPNSISDLAAMNALYRPGPMDFIDEFIDRKFGRKKIEYLHPSLEPILRDTYGIIVYQEQVIQIANKIAGMSLAEADLLRRAMGKKDAAAMAEQKDKFVKGAIANGIDEKIALKIFEDIDKFANYGFNKSHAVAYSIVAYQTAYLKAHFPAEFLAANMSNEFNDIDKIAPLLEDCRRLKIPVSPPNVNNPSVFFNVANGKIIFGMSAIKNLGISAVEEIQKTRNRIGRNFTSIYDFCAQVDNRIVNKKALEALALSGAFDEIHPNRAQVFAAIETALEYGQKFKKSYIDPSESLFADTDFDITIKEPDLPKIPDWDIKEKLAKERSALNFYLSSHPLDKHIIEYNSFATIKLGEINNAEEIDSKSARVIGVINDVETKLDKAGRRMAFFKLVDLTGSAECIIFSDAYMKYEEWIKEEEPVMAYGITESSGDRIKLQVEKVLPLEKVKYELTKSINLILRADELGLETIDVLKNIFEKNSGKYPVFLIVLENGGKPRTFHLPNYKISLSNEILKDLTEVLGEENIILKE